MRLVPEIWFFLNRLSLASLSQAITDVVDLSFFFLIGKQMTDAINYDINIETIQALAEYARFKQTSFNLQLTPVKRGLLYFGVNAFGGVELRLLAQHPRRLLTLTQADIRGPSFSAEYLRDGITFMGKCSLNPRLAATMIERFAVLSKEEFVEAPSRPKPASEQDLGFSDNEHLDELFEVTSQLMESVDSHRGLELGGLEQIELTGNVRGNLALFCNGKLQICKKRRRQGRPHSYRILFQTHCEGLDVEKLERQIQRQFDKSPKDWEARHDVVYFLQHLQNVKPPKFLSQK